MAQNDTLYQAIAAAFRMEEGDAKATSETGARALTDIMVAFAGEIARAVEQNKHHGIVGALDYRTAGQAQPSAFSAQIDQSGQIARFEVTSERSHPVHPATDDIYLSDDYPLDGCPIVLILRDGNYSLAVYRPGVQNDWPVPIEAYSEREVSGIGGVMHAFVNGHLRQ